MSIKGFFDKHIALHDVNMWVAGALYGIAVYLILVILQPFGISIHGDERFVKMLPFALVTLVGFVAPYYIIPLFKKDFFYVKDWTRGRLAILTMAIMTIIVIGNMTIFVELLGAPVNLEVAWIAFWQTLVIGCLIFSIILFLPEKKKNEEIKQEKTQEIILRGAGKDEDVMIQLDKLLYVESSRNNCNIVTTDSETQIRSTMIAIEEALAEFKEMKKCHRAYLVNTNNIVTMDGNSTSGYKLIMKGGMLTVPVSRQYVKDMLALQ